MNIAKLNFKPDSAEVYRDKIDDRLYMKINYIAEDEHGKYLMCIPKILFPFDRLVEVCQEANTKRFGNTYVTIGKPKNLLSFSQPLSESYNLKNFSVQAFTDKEDNIYTVEQIEEKTRKVTITDIEEKFGCKVEIVKDK